MLKHEIMLAEKYRHLSIRASGGKVVLTGLPERTETERKLIRHVFSSSHCRLCGDCCKGFSFSTDEPNYREIANGIERDRQSFTMKVRETRADSTIIFRADPAFSGKCGFFESEFDTRRVPGEILEAGGDFREEGAPFGCGIYPSQPRVCGMFPVSTGLVENPGNGEHLAKEAMYITAECKPIMELYMQGIGHILAREILEFWPRGENNWLNFGQTLANCMGIVNGLMLANEIGGFQFLSERNELILPIKRAGIPPASSG